MPTKTYGYMERLRVRVKDDTENRLAVSVGFSYVVCPYTVCIVPVKVVDGVAPVVLNVPTET